MRKPWKLALVVAGVAVVAKLVTSKNAAWQGLTESELRDKLDSRLPSQMPEEKRAAVADKVVASMNKRGAIRQEDDVDVSVDGAADDEIADNGAGDDSADDESSEETETS